MSLELQRSGYRDHTALSRSVLTSSRAAGRYAPARPIAADLRPRADGSVVRTALLAWRRRSEPSWPSRDRQTDGQTDRRSRHRLMTHPLCRAGFTPSGDPVQKIMWGP